MFKLRNQFINTTAMFLAPPDDNNQQQDDTRSDAQKQRDSIQISDSTETDADDNNNDNDADNDDENEEDEDEENDDDNVDDDADKDKDKDKDKEETEEEKTARIAQEKEDRKQARIQRKFDKIAAEKTTAENRVKELERQLAEKPVEGLTEEEVQRRAEALAATKLTEKQIEDANKAFEKNCDMLEAAAMKVDKDFGRKVQEMTSEIGPIPKPIIDTLAELDNENGGDVLAYLADNVDEADDIYELKTNPRKLAIKLTRISDKLKEAKKPARKERSNLPPPIDPIGGNTRDTSNRITGKETQEEFNAKRARQIEERRKQQGMI